MAAMLDESVGDRRTPQDVEKLHSQMLQRIIDRSPEAWRGSASRR
jgi:hypothetical protein